MVNGSVVTKTSQIGVIGINGTDLHLFNAPGQSHAGGPTFSPCP
jgi:hypothetical protein